MVFNAQTSARPNLSWVLFVVFSGVHEGGRLGPGAECVGHAELLRVQPQLANHRVQGAAVAGAGTQIYGTWR